MNLSDALESFLQAGKADNLARSTLTWYAALLRPMVADLAASGHTTLESVTTVRLREYIVSLRERQTRYGEQRPEVVGGLSAESVASNIRALHRFWRWCADEYDIQNPAARIKHPGKGKTVPKGIASDDLRNMLFKALENEDVSAAARDAAMIALLADSGCRAGGLLSLNVKDVDLERRSALVIEKGDKLRRVYFLPITAIALARWIALRPETQEAALFVALKNGHPVGRLKYSGLYQALKRIAARCGIRGRFNPHSFRHGFARDYLLNGGDLATLAQILGHSSVTTTAHYYALFEQTELAAQHNRFSPMGKVSEDDSTRRR